MILPPQTIRRLKIMSPCHERTVSPSGMTYGLANAGYDVRIDQDLVLKPHECALASTMEEFNMPNDVCADVKDKSTWARLFVTVQNTFIEPGWRGCLTLEIVNHSQETAVIKRGDPIAQIVFMRMEEPTERPYEGKYQDQERGPQAARRDKPTT